jgi:hypothetical protein
MANAYSYISTHSVFAVNQENFIKSEWRDHCRATSAWNMKKNIFLVFMSKGFESVALWGFNLSNNISLPKYRPSWPYSNEDCENNDRMEVKSPKMVIG